MARKSTPGTDEILTTHDVANEDPATEEVVGHSAESTLNNERMSKKNLTKLKKTYRAPDEGNQSIPETDATEEVIMIPRLAVVVISLRTTSEKNELGKRKSKTNLAGKEYINNTVTRTVDLLLRI